MMKLDNIYQGDCLELMKDIPDGFVGQIAVEWLFYALNH